MKRVWKKPDGSINIYIGKNQKAKATVMALAKRHGYDAIDMVDQIAIEPTKKSELIKKLNRELTPNGMSVFAKIVEADSLKEYLSDYASMSKSPELKEYLGKMEQQAEEMHDKAQHSLKDCVDEAERKMEAEEDVAEAREIEQKDIDFVRSKMGSGLLKHAIFSPEMIEKQKSATLERALLNAAKESGYPISDFAMWASSEDAAILADELYAELANVKLQHLPSQGKFTKMFIENMNDFFKGMNRNEYLYEHNEWEERLGKQSKPRSASLMKKIKHLFAA